MTRIPGSELRFQSVIGEQAEHARKVQGLSRPEFVARLGYENIGRGCRKYAEFLEGKIEQKFILDGLPGACGVDLSTVQLWLEQSRHNIQISRLRAFRPHGVIKTERERPLSIFIAAFTGACGRKHVAFDFGSDAPSFVAQVLAAIPRRAGESGVIPTFGRPTGIIINLTPFYARHYDLQGNFIEETAQAFYLGTTTMRIGGKAVELTALTPRAGGNHEG